MSFLITGYGRSGTKFLSKILNLSQTWEVLHEPRKDDDFKLKKNIKHQQKINNLFSKRNKYGEVNSYLRFHYKKIQCKHKVFLVRNPYNIFLSTANRYTTFEPIKYVDSISENYNNLIRDINYFDKVIFFEDITTDINKIKSLANYLDIYDLPIEFINLNKKINTNNINNKKFNSFSDLPEQVKKYTITKLDKYAKYFNYKIN